MSTQTAPVSAPPSGGPRADRRRSDLLVGGLAVAAAVGALWADGSPAGLAVADAAFRAGFAAVVVLATATARRWTWIVLAGVAAATAEGTLLVGLAVAALLVALAAALLDRREPVLGAAVAAASVQALLGLPDLGFSGASALVAAAAVGPALASALQLADPRVRRIVAWSLAGAAAFSLVAALGFGVAALQASTSVSDGISLSQAGFDSARDGEEASAVENLRGASSAFGEADDALGAPWAAPARLVPVLGLQARAVQEVTAEGADLTSTAAAAADETDLDSLQFVDGRIDLGLVADFEAPLQDGADALAQAAATVDEVDSPWLVGPLATRVDRFEAEVDRALPDAELAIAGVRVAPALFGGEGERNYFIAFTTPSEMRGLGGFMGNWGQLTAIDGDPELVDSGRIENLNLAAREVPAELHGPPDYLARWGRYEPEHWLQDVTFSPDMPSVSEVAADLYRQASGQEVAGVIVVDPYALAALLTFTGPVQLSDYPEPLTAENAADILLREQYLTFDERAERKDFLDEATRVVFERLTSGDIPGPRQVADVLGPVVEQGRLMVHSFDPEEQALFEEVGLDGTFPEQPEGGDFFSVVTQNSANNKIDMFLHRSIDYQATFDPDTGGVEATATITLRNDAPPSGLPDVILSSGERILTGAGPPLGTNQLNLSFYSPLVLGRASVDGLPIALESGVERGLNAYSGFLDVPPGGTIEVVLELSGAIAPSDEYRVGVGMQPLVNPDAVTTRLTVADGWALDGGDYVPSSPAEGAVEVVTTEGDQRVTAVLRPS